MKQAQADDYWEKVKLNIYCMPDTVLSNRIASRMCVEYKYCYYLPQWTITYIHILDFTDETKPQSRLLLDTKDLFFFQE